jgi:hypothetical protein
MTFAKQRDRNEPGIVAALERAGAAVQRLSEAGVPDLLVSFRGELYLIEVKNPAAKGGGKYNTGDGALTATQTRWWATWKGKAPAIVTDAMQALRVIGAVQ